MMSDDRLAIEDQRKELWYKIDSLLMLEYGSIIGVYGIAVYNALAVHANKQTHEAYPSYQTIADMIGCSRRKVIQTMEILEGFNIIRGKGRFDKKGSPMSNIWILVDKGDWLNPGGENSRLLHEVVNDVHYPSAPDAPSSEQDALCSAPYAPEQESDNKSQLTKEREQPQTTLSRSDKDRLNDVSEIFCIWCYGIGVAKARDGQREKIKAAVLDIEETFGVTVEGANRTMQDWNLPKKPWPSQLLSAYGRSMPDPNSTTTQVGGKPHERKSTQYQYFKDTPLLQVMS